MATDLAVVTQDPRFGGGVRTQLDAFLTAARTLGRSPEACYVVHPSLRGLGMPGIGVSGAPGPASRIDALNTLVGAARLAPRVRDARSLWVVSTVASAGAGALFSGRRYDCWIGTGIGDEWAARLPSLPRSRRLALRLNAPGLLALERRVLRGADAVYATTPASRASLAAAAGIPLERVGVLPIPVETERFAPAPEAEWLSSLTAPTIAFVGRSDDPRKNVAMLLDAMPAIRRAVPDATVTLIGRPPRRPLPEGVEALGEVASVADALRRATLFVLPSLQEGFGIVAAEALSCGVPVVTTPSGGPEELVRASGGGRVLAGFDPDELAETVVSLLRDTDALAAMRRAGRAYVEAEHAPGRFQERLSRLLEYGGADA